MEKVAIIASGPSLSDGQIALVKRYGIYTIAVNDSWRKAPFAQLIYASDYAWWKENHAAVPPGAEKWTGNHTAAAEFALHHHVMHETYNSGMRSIDLALKIGAQAVILLGFDCAFAEGKRHWHGDHSAPLSNPTQNTLTFWATHFRRLKKAHPGAVIVNASEYTNLTMFPRLSLHEALRSNVGELERLSVTFNQNSRST